MDPNHTTPTYSRQYMLEATRAINSWQISRIKLVQQVAERTMQNLTSKPTIDIDSFSNSLDSVLFSDFNLNTESLPSPKPESEY